MYDHILLPTDGSEGMAPIIDHAVSLAKTHDATLHALYVVNTTSLNDLPMESSWEGLRQALEREGNAALEVVEQQAGQVSLRTSLREGVPAQTITEFAEEESCDVVVMGTHGRSGVNRLLLGSVAERVVRTSSVPVLTIRVDRSQSS